MDEHTLAEKIKEAWLAAADQASNYCDTMCVDGEIDWFAKMAAKTALGGIL